MAKTLKYLAIMVCFIVSLTGCKDKNIEAEKGSITINVKAKYDDQAFVLHTSNTDPNGRRIRIDALKFYLSHIKLVKADNSEVELKDVVMCDFSDTASLTYKVNDVGGDFKSVKFSVGVDAAQNLTDPNLQPSASPLSNDKDMYWAMFKYIFHKVDGRCDTTTGGSGSFNSFFSYHPGTDALYRSASLTKNVSVCCKNDVALNLVLDVKKIFWGAQTIDVRYENKVQMDPSDNQAIAPKFADNFSQAFSVE